jgi:1-acyl-sn-glycerol-3-phosphate acyltransferase
VPLSDDASIYNPERRAEVVKRRLVTIPRSIGLFAILTLGAPLWVALTVVVDAVRLALFRKPMMATRMLAFAWVWFASELIGLTRFTWHWIEAAVRRDRSRLVDRAWAVQAWWARTLLDTVRRLFRLDLAIEDLDLATPGPVIAMFRHASIIDNLLPTALLTDRKGLKLRWIIKRELLSIPALDVGGKRLPNYFVDRESSDPRRELRTIRRLAEDLDTDEGVLIYPEGTRFTEARQARAIAKLRDSGSALADRAAKLRYVMPPKVGGVLTLLDAGTDILLCAHEGLGGFAKLRDIWSGAMMDRTITVKFWRIAASKLPGSRAERVDWLFSQWELFDAWIASVRARRLAAPDPA